MIGHGEQCKLHLGGDVRRDKFERCHGPFGKDVGGVQKRENGSRRNGNRILTESDDTGLHKTWGRAVVVSGRIPPLEREKLAWIPTQQMYGNKANPKLDPAGGGRPQNATARLTEESEGRGSDAKRASVNGPTSIGNEQQVCC